MIDAFTVASEPHLGEVRLLARSVADFLPGSRFHWFVTGPLSDDLSARFAGIATVTPLARVSEAVKAPETSSDADVEIAEVEVGALLAALELLQRDDCTGVLLIAPQVVLFSPLPELMAANRLCHEIVLTPAVIQPEADNSEELPGGELRALRHGVYSTSMVGIGRGEVGLQFLQWWRDRAREFVPPPDRHHALRPWLNLAPALFPNVGVLRSARCSVGRDNLHERRLLGSLDQGFTVDGEPLGFFDFAGHDDGSLAATIRDGPGDRLSLESLLQWYRNGRRCGRESADDDSEVDRLPS